MPDRLDQPKDLRRQWRPRVDADLVGRGAEAIARFMGTGRFLIYMTAFVAAWMAWNSYGPEGLRFDQAKLGFTALTLVLSLQASYAAPLILLAQNRQTDRDRVGAEQDRRRAERSLADTEYLAREIAALRIALSEVATRDFVRSELRDLLDELEAQHPEPEAAEKPKGKGKHKGKAKPDLVEGTEDAAPDDDRPTDTGDADGDA